MVVPDAGGRAKALETIREALLEQLEEEELTCARIRGRAERIESDLRLGAAPGEEYAQIKGHDLPRAEIRLVQTYRDLLKVEEKLLAARR